MSACHSLFCEQVLLPDGWEVDVTLTVGSDGTVTAIEKGAGSASFVRRACGPVVPALHDIHSHAFQLAMAGLAERAISGEDSFWTWRELMYRLADCMTPDDIEIVATKLYSELLKGGFAHVVEFHYLHHGSGGRRYSDPAETSLRILRAASKSGIGLTHLPAFYAHSGFGGADPAEGQLPFVQDVDQFMDLLATLKPECAVMGARLGLAIHSLRAATPEEMRIILSAENTGGPIHIHVAEQEREVADCLAWSGRRPVQFLLDEMPVDSRWCTIHATHMTPDEAARLAGSGAVAGLCPMTEGNLGDGIFPATEFFAKGGTFGIGTDSQVGTSLAEELRLLEYSQRLRDHRRNRLAHAPGASVGRSLFDGALKGGAQAAGERGCGIRIGGRADLVVLDGSTPFIGAAAGDQILDRWLFASGGRAVRDVMANGQWVVQDRRHRDEEEIDRAFYEVLLKLT